MGLRCRIKGVCELREISSTEGTVVEEIQYRADALQLVFCIRDSMNRFMLQLLNLHRLEVCLTLHRDRAVVATTEKNMTWSRYKARALPLQ